MIKTRDAHKGTLRWVPYVVIAGLTLLAAAMATAISDHGGGSSFTDLAAIAQSIISIGVPVVTAILGTRWRGLALLTVTRLLPTVVGFAWAMATAGTVIAALVNAAAGGGWESAGAAIFGSMVAQTVASLIGLGLGTLIGRPVVAGLLTIALPLGLLQALHLVAPALAPWLTPYPHAARWWSGTMTTDRLPAFLAMILLWCIGLNLAGWMMQSRRTATGASAQN